MVLHGRAEEKMLEIPDESIDLICTSPPYNMGMPYPGVGDSMDWGEYWDMIHTTLVEQANRVLVTGGRLAVNWPGYAMGKRDGEAHHHIFAGMARERFLLMAEIVWEQNVGARTAWGSFGSPSAPRFPSHHEFIQIWAKGSASRDASGKLPSDITNAEFSEWAQSTWKFGGVKSAVHPAIFPDELPRRLIKMLTWPGERVLDPYCGSCTTLRVSESLGREAIGIEVVEEYAALAAKKEGD